MIDRPHTLPVKRQAEELGINRSNVYYLPRPVSSEDLAIMRRIDALHLEFPFAGSRMIRDFLRQEGITIARCHVASLMKKMANEADFCLEARSSIGRYLVFYNARRAHSSFGGRTADQTYFNNLPQAVAA